MEIISSFENLEVNSSSLPCVEEMFCSDTVLIFRNAVVVTNLSSTP
ncbi:Uncharacterised protein [Porphyromonas cangingivalis]|uniref:Uncharacterized protein n=1 Tax=Porphyromonas cangingivalis TaxID=36874 RepID=A0A1T4MY10_PORCN|nr:hypothetical protein SAMN02745205_01718 [Porphyromonas cangingivalis]VEJ04193.1 Uncharacterised protein [Porphyromonas cangingivalis]